MANKFKESFEKPNNFKNISDLVNEVLKDYGGLFLNGYKSTAPASWRSKEIYFSKDIIINELAKAEVREAIYKGLKSFNESHVGPYSFYPFTIHIKNGKKY